MGFKEIIQRMKERKEERRESFKQLQMQDKLHELLEERKKSSNQRELEGYMKEEREKQIKQQLDIVRKRRENDLKYNYNPLHTPNVVKDSKWNVLKEKNIFKEKGNIFVNQPYVHKSNKNLLKNNKRLMGI